MARILGIQKELAAKEMKADISFADSRKDNPANMTMSKNTLTWVFTIYAMLLLRYVTLQLSNNGGMQISTHNHMTV